MSTHPRPSFWLVIVTLVDGRRAEVAPAIDNRKTARHIAAVNRKLGHDAVVVKRHEWVSDSGHPQVPNEGP